MTDTSVLRSARSGRVSEPTLVDQAHGTRDQVADYCKTEIDALLAGGIGCFVRLLSPALEDSALVLDLKHSY